jgi:hypothetical protein
MSWWLFGKQKNVTTEDASRVTASVHPRQEVEQAPTVINEMACSDTALVEQIIEDDCRKAEIDALVALIESCNIQDRLDYVKAEKPLRGIAENSTYADNKMKELRKRLFERLKAKTDAEEQAQANEKEFANLLDELTDHKLIEDWFDNTVIESYDEQTVSLVVDIREGRALRTPLANVIEVLGNAKTGYAQRYGSQKIRNAAEIIERDFFKATNRLIKFFEDREGTVLPRFRRELALATNKFGDSDYADYFSEVTEFCDYAAQNTDLSVLSPYIRRRMMGMFILFRIEELKDAEITEERIPVDGYEFEVWCAEQIQRQGWQIEATPKSGDQGVDIVVRREGIIVAVQCKRYASPIGNAAVQEVHAGRTYIGAKGAIVVGTGGFTKAAHNIAAISKVELLDAMDIARFSEVFGLKSKAVNPKDQQVFVAESYAQCEIVKSVYFGMKSTMPEVMDALLKPDTLETFRSSFNEINGKGVAYLTGVQAAQILAYSSIIYTGKIKLTQQIRDHFSNQDDMNKILITDQEVNELMWYQFYDAYHMEQILVAFKNYVAQFGVHQLTFAFLNEFE